MRKVAKLFARATGECRKNEHGVRRKHRSLRAHLRHEETFLLHLQNSFCPVHNFSNLFEELQKFVYYDFWMRTSFCKPDYAQFTSLESIQATARVRLLLRSYVQLAYRLLQLQLLVGNGEKRFPFYAFLGSFSRTTEIRIHRLPTPCLEMVKKRCRTPAPTRPTTLTFFAKLFSSFSVLP
jgi:hypothetical protein